MIKVNKIGAFLLLQTWLSACCLSQLMAQVPILNEKYSFQFANNPLPSVIDSLRKTVNYGFSYNPDDFPREYCVNMSFRKERLQVILDSILHPIHLSYKLIDNNFVILPEHRMPESHDENNWKDIIDSLSIIKLSGTVIDKYSKEPIDYASVYIKAKNIGTLSNNDGNFTIKLPQTAITDSIFFSCIGYKPCSLKISDLRQNDNTILLEIYSFQLKEVQIKPVKPEDILKKAIENIPRNYSCAPSMLTAFYREIIQQNNEYVALSEAILRIYKAPYNSFTNDQVTIYKGRKSRFEKQMDTVIFKFQGGISTSLMLDIAKNPSNFIADEYLTYYDFSLEDNTYIQGRPVYVIAFDQKNNIPYPLFKGNIYIDTETYAFVRADFMISPKGLDQAAGVLVRKSPRKLKVKPTFSSYIVNYTLVNNQWYLNYVHEELEFKVRRKMSLYAKTFRSKAEMVVTQTDSANVKRFRLNQLVRITDIFVEKIGPYDPDFWGNYNTIKPEEPLEVAMHKLEKSTRHEIKKNMPTN